MTPPPVSIADLVGSSKYAAIADDSLKDEDNAAWVMFLPPEVAADWIEVISWLRLIDRMAENEWLEGWGSRLQIFRIGWRALLVTGQVLPDDYHADLLTKMHRRWFTGKRGVMDWSPIHAWDEYVDAISEYHRSDMVFETIEEYERMLSRLGGSLLQVCPLLSDSQRLTVRAFGVMDQFFNQLRDLEEDTAQNLCYFPADVLDRFGVDRQELIDRSCFKNDGYHRMMRFWLDDYLPTLYVRASEFLSLQNLHYSWRLLRHWWLRRYARIERGLRICNMDFCAANKLYFSEVKPNLSSWLQETFTAENCTELLLRKVERPQPIKAEQPEPAQAQLADERVPLPERPPGISLYDSGLIVLQRQRSMSNR